MKLNPLDPIGYIFITVFFILLAYAGYLAGKSIDWTVLRRLESTPISLPAPISSPSATALSPTPAAKPPTAK